jgi:endonuclease-3
LLVATILSAQCTDKRVNIVTPALFAAYPTPRALADAKLDDIKQLIKSTGFYNNKAKSIQLSARMVCDVYQGKVPETMEELLKLPGVARKTANVVLGNWYHRNDGVVVDTHVKRLSGRLGLTKVDNPEQIERDLVAQFPQAEWTELSLRLIEHGRQICFARKPNCAGCPLQNICPSAFQV